jgi:uncharacterized protein (DUF362 family)
MKLHPLLQDPDSVLVSQIPLGNPVEWADFHRAAIQVMSALTVELQSENAVIKPNVTSGEHFADADTGITTHPGFVHGMVDYLRQKGTPYRRITIAEDPRNTDDNLPRHWRGTGFELLAQQTGVRLHTTTTYTCVKKQVPNPLAHGVLNVSRLATAPNSALFNVPKLKTHNLAITTLCLKNLMGLVNVADRHYCSQAWQELPQEVRTNERPRNEWLEREMHERWQDGLARRLADTAQVIQPALNIVEGVIGREGTGFQRGRNRPLGLAVAGTNMVAVDSLVSYLVGFDPQRLVYLQVANRVGLGTNDVHQLRVYTVQDGEPVLCSDLKSLRIYPPFRVISGIKGEEQDPFQSDEMPTRDPTLIPMAVE